MIAITVLKEFNGSPIPELMTICNFKKYTLKAGESWIIEDDQAAMQLMDTFPFVKKAATEKNLEKYTPEVVGNANYLENKYLGQEKEDNGILDGGYPGLEVESL